MSTAARPPVRTQREILADVLLTAYCAPNTRYVLPTAVIVKATAEHLGAATRDAACDLYSAMCIAPRNAASATIARRLVRFLASINTPLPT